MALEQKILQSRPPGAPVKMPAGRPPGAMPGGLPAGMTPPPDDGGNQGSVFTRIRSMFFKPGDTNTPVVSTFTSSRDTNPPVKLVLPPPSIDWNKSRQQKLAELLEEYRKEKLTPTEYHEKRREILAAQ